MNGSAKTQHTPHETGKPLDKAPASEPGFVKKQKRIVKPVWGESAPDDIWPTYAPDTD